MEFDEKRPLYRLEEIAAILRGENGCAWDIKQTPQTLKPYLIEEAYELYDAIESGDVDHMKEELGDLLYQVYAHSQIASEEKDFTIDDVATGMCEKLIRRHPHVFGDEKAIDADEVSVQWEKIKKEEKSHRESVLEGVPKHLPALLKSYRIQQKVSRIGFDWENVEGAIAKLEEEIQELKDAINSGNEESIFDESGDILFSIVNVMRFIKVNPEEALQGSIQKFITRFSQVERMANKREFDMTMMSIEELEELWQIVKKT